MNYLAHAYLSDTEYCLIGNLLGDFVKGVADKISFPSEIKRGIMLHREIDAFADSHPITIASRKRFRDEHSLFSGILIDVFYDHLLAVNFDKFSEVGLDEFADATYKTVVKHFDFFPKNVQAYFKRMMDKNWLVSYKNIEIVQKVLERLSEQLTMSNSLDGCSFYLKEYYIEFEQDFMKFFPELIKFVHSFNTNYTDL